MVSCNVEIWKGHNLLEDFEENVPLNEADARLGRFRQAALMYGAKHEFRNLLYCIRQHDEELDAVTSVRYFTEADVSDEELERISDEVPCADIYVIRNRTICIRRYDEEKSKRIVPVTLKEANAFVQQCHRHHDSVTGCKFAVGLKKTVKGQDVLTGVAISGRPVSRVLDDGYTLEVNRCCVSEADATGNECSMLYAACTRIAKAMGYRKVITYTLESEDGGSLRASGFELEDGHCGGKKWTGDRECRSEKRPPEEYKKRWAKSLL